MNGIAVEKPLSDKGWRVDFLSRATVRPVDLWWAAFAMALIPISLLWDFSWESSIGVDRFWSPPHLATQVGVWLTGLLGAWLLFAFTRNRKQGGSAAGVSIGRLCGPSGAWILLWGAVALQAALVFDNWWQKVYGLGPGLWHPPQILKAVGFFTLLFGGVVLCAGARASGMATGRVATALLIWHGGLVLTMCALVLTVKNYPNWQHTAGFYQVSCAIYPAVLLAIGHGAQGRWGATRTASVYILIVCAMVWLLPLFPARPLAAPIHNPTDHMMPPAFPLLLAVPAVLMDWLRIRILPQPGGADPQVGPTRLEKTNRLELWLAVATGASFLAAFVLAQWLFSEFLLSSSADNWFFAGGGRHWPFFLKIDEARVMFWGVKQDPLTWEGAILAMLLAVASSWIGLRVGTWMSKLCR